MTICEKFKLMMASFADIKAAIAEKGGTVTGGYADYAKNIRNLYSNDTYAPQYQYPTEKSPIMQYLINLYNRITFCYAVKQEIRQAIIDGGVDHRFQNMVIKFVKYSVLRLRQVICIWANIRLNAEGN